MHHDHHRSVKAERDHERKEWGRDADREHETQAREHARLSGRTRRTRGAREDDAKRQIRELRGRY